MRDERMADCGGEDDDVAGVNVSSDNSSGESCSGDEDEMAEVAAVSAALDDLSLAPEQAGGNEGTAAAEGEGDGGGDTSGEDSAGSEMAAVVDLAHEDEYGSAVENSSGSGSGSGEGSDAAADDDGNDAGSSGK